MIQLINLSIDELRTVIASEVNKINLETTVNNDLMNAKTTCEFLKISIKTLHNWKDNGTLKAYYLGSLMYFKKTEIIAALTPLHQKQ